MNVSTPTMDTGTGFKNNKIILGPLPEIELVPRDPETQTESESETQTLNHRIIGTLVSHSEKLKQLVEFSKIVESPGITVQRLIDGTRDHGAKHELIKGYVAKIDTGTNVNKCLCARDIDIVNMMISTIESGSRIRTINEIFDQELKNMSDLEAMRRITDPVKEKEFIDSVISWSPRIARIFDQTIIPCIKKEVIDSIRGF